MIYVVAWTYEGKKQYKRFTDMEAVEAAMATLRDIEGVTDVMFRTV